MSGTPQHRGPIGTPKSVEAWASKAWRSVPESVDAVCILVVEGFGGPETVCTWPLDMLSKNAAAWTNEVFEVAVGDAESRGQRTSYVIRVVNAAELSTTYASRNLRIDPEGSPLGVQENTSLAGIVGMLMRHTEGLTKQMVVMSERVTSAMGTSMLALAERTAELERENAKLARKLREQEANEGEQAAIMIDAERIAKREEKIFDFIEKAAAAKAMKELGLPKPKPKPNGTPTPNGGKKG